MNLISKIIYVFSTFIKYQLLKSWWNRKINFCPLCAHREKELFFSKISFGKRIDLYQCNSCSFVYQSPILNDKGLKNYYSNMFRSNKNVLHHNKMFIRGENRGKKIHDLISRYFNLQGSCVIEIGCGYGGILQTFKNKGANVFGCDLDPTGIDFGKKNGLNLKLGDYKSLSKLEGKCDVIILSHVLEHIFELKDFVNGVSKFLKKNGLLYIALPGVESETAREKNYAIQPGHIYYFSEKTLSDLLVSNFRILYSNRKIEAIFQKK